jgi:GNAT superfamily N-acetyltransferase
MRLRTMTPADIPAGMRLKELAGWNQSEADWERFLAASPDGCFVAEVDGAVRGTAATISYEGKFAWVGMVLVDPEFRGKGIGTQLLEKTIEYLDAAKIPAIKLDATPLGKPIYEKLGFVTEYEIERMILKRDAADGSRQTASPGVDSRQLRTVFGRDREFFGADRSGLLQSLHDKAPELTLVLERESKLAGYAFGRRGSFADQMGPWMAADAQACEELLNVFLARCQRETLIVDCMKSHPTASRLVRARGFSYARPLTRMYRGKNEYPGEIESLCAILGPEFG